VVENHSGFGHKLWLSPKLAPNSGQTGQATSSRLIAHLQATGSRLSPTKKQIGRNIQEREYKI